MSHPLSDTQQKKVDEAVRLIHEAFPDASGKSLETVIEAVLLPKLLGPPPKWSEKSGGYHIGRGAVFNSGAFCVYWGEDPDTGKLVALVHVRKEKKNGNGQYKYGAVGGYTEHPEQAFIGVLREAWEEVCDGKGEPAMMTEPHKQVIMLEGKDYTKNPPVQYTGYACKLEPQQIKALKTHIRRCDDPAYQAQVTEASNGETMGLKLMPLEDIIALSPGDFMYHRQYDVYREMAARLGVGQDKVTPSSPLGYTIGDASELYVSRLIRSEDGKVTKYRAY